MEDPPYDFRLNMLSSSEIYFRNHVAGDEVLFVFDAEVIDQLHAELERRLR